MFKYTDVYAYIVKIFLGAFIIFIFLCSPSFPTDRVVQQVSFPFNILAFLIVLVCSRHMPQVYVFVLFFLEMSLFCLHFWSVFLLKNLIFFSFKHFIDSFYCLLASAVCDGKSNVICIVCSPISHVSIFLWLLFKICCLCFIINSLTILPQLWFSWDCFLCSLLRFLQLWHGVFQWFGQNFSHFFFKTHLCLSPSSLSRAPATHILEHLLLSYTSQVHCSFIPFYLLGV